MKKFTTKFSRISGSTDEKIRRALRHGWRPGLGPVGEFARKRSRQMKGTDV